MTSLVRTLLTLTLLSALGLGVVLGRAVHQGDGGLLVSALLYQAPLPVFTAGLCAVAVRRRRT